MNTWSVTNWWHQCFSDLPTVCHSPLVRGLKIWLQSLREALRDQLCFSCWSPERSAFFSCWSTERSTLFFLLELWEINFFSLAGHMSDRVKLCSNRSICTPHPQILLGMHANQQCGKLVACAEFCPASTTAHCAFQQRGRSLQWKEVRWMELGEGGEEDSA